MGIITRNPRASLKYLKTIGLRDDDMAAFGFRPADKSYYGQEKIWLLVGRAAQGNHEFPPLAFAHAALFLCHVATREELFYHR